MNKKIMQSVDFSGIHHIFYPKKGLAPNQDKTIKKALIEIFGSEAKINFADVEEVSVYKEVEHEEVEIKQLGSNNTITHRANTDGSNSNFFNSNKPTPPIRPGANNVNKDALAISQQADIPPVVEKKKGGMAEVIAKAQSDKSTTIIKKNSTASLGGLAGAPPDDWASQIGV